MRKTIEIQGARENNLRNVSAELPPDALIVVTGVSESGKSSFAFSGTPEQVAKCKKSHTGKFLCPHLK